MGTLSRRAVLGGAIGTAGAAALGAGPAIASATIRTAPVRSNYSGSVGQVFTAEHDGHRYRLKLTHIHDLPHCKAKHRPHNFLLVFAPVGHRKLPDAIYRLSRRGVRAHRLFLSSLGTERGMQAVINRQH
jgi:hypothetical protein